MKSEIMSTRDFRSFLDTTFNPVTDNSVYHPKFKDLYSLYRLIRKRKVISVLEFGSGWSTLVIAKALEENQKLFEGWVEQKIRHPNPFKVLTVDASKSYQEIALNRLRIHHLSQVAVGAVSSVGMTILNSSICTLFNDIPPFTADLIYLDGPDCGQVSGSVNGFNVQFGDEEKLYGLPMSGDILMLEPFLWPGTMILVDGRGANARFLRTHLSRKWKYSFDRRTDQHLFRLTEAPWGKYSSNLLKFRKTKLFRLLP